MFARRVYMHLKPNSVADLPRGWRRLPSRPDQTNVKFVVLLRTGRMFLQPLGKLRNAIGLHMHINSGVKHGTLLGSRCQRGDSITTIGSDILKTPSVRNHTE